MARPQYTNDYIKGTAAMRRRDPVAERAALRERVPEKLPCKYAVVEINHRGEERQVFVHDELKYLFANSGFGPDTTRRMIDNGLPLKVFGGHRKIVPAKPEPQFDLKHNYLEAEDEIF